jgi:anhydro-N-acetylmuramic acid kinase
MNRTVIGLSVGSGLEGADVAAVRAAGIGLDLVPKVEAAARVLFPPAARDLLKPNSPVSPDLVRNVAETAAHAARTAAAKAGVSPRDVFAAGLLTPARGGGHIPWNDVADRVAEQTGLTVVHSFRSRDRAAGGSGHPIAAAADYLLFRDPKEARLLVHLGAVASVLLVPAAARVSAVLGFEAGPGNQLLDAVAYHGTRGRDRFDAGGKTAVQGRRLDALLDHWADHPYLTRRPPKAVHPEAFGAGFLAAAFDAAKQLGAGLPDLLCTATHLVARSVGEACRRWLPAGSPRVVLSGGGVRNGFLWQLIGAQFEGRQVTRTDDLGVPALARSAAAAGVLALLTCDGVAGNLPLLTGAASGRVLGQIAPGDGRNWARAAAWLADQTTDPARRAV